MEKLGFRSGNADTMVFICFRTNNMVEISGWFVDDSLLAANSVTSMDHMIDSIKGSFNIQDLGEPDQLLGIRISQDRELGTIHISQPSLINTIIQQFDISAGREISSPMDPSSDL